MTLQVIPGDGTLKNVMEPVSNVPQQFFRMVWP
jgi:hypothetical protein